MLTPANPNIARNIEVIENTIKTLEEKGWVQGTLMNKDGFCVRGAIQHCCQTYIEADRFEARLRNFIGCTSIPVWNDSIWRSKSQIISMLKAFRSALMDQLIYGDSSHEDIKKSYSDKVSDKIDATNSDILSITESMDDQDRWPDGPEQTSRLVSCPVS